MRHPIWGRVYRIPQYLRRLKGEMETELRGKIVPKFPKWPLFFKVTVEPTKPVDMVNLENHIGEVEPHQNVGSLKLMRMLIEHVWRDAKALIKKDMKGKVDGV
ncbi:uncharacterized protein LOC108137535 isoform X2 [Drosophila elegans]|nr:uncharacterized protein LOC108137535 isoform X2 [Drosophila elegans]